MYLLCPRIWTGRIEGLREHSVLYLGNRTNGRFKEIGRTSASTSGSRFHFKYGEDEKRCDRESPRPLGFFLSISQPTNHNPHRPPSPLTPIDPPPPPLMSHKKSAGP